VEVAIVHDYFTQRGGAERVAIVMARAFPDAVVHTSVVDVAGTFPDAPFERMRPSPLNHLGPLRTRHRALLPLLAPVFSSMVVDAPVVVCSSSGWAHGVRATGRKLVYCHNPARWLYQTTDYVRGHRLQALALRSLAPSLRRWDRKAAASADLYVANSTVVARRIEAAYGRHAEVLFPPVSLDASAPQESLGLECGFLLCVSRLMPYKNLDAAIEGVAGSGRRLVVVGDGPERARLAALARGRADVAILHRVSDAQLRWLYQHCAAVLAPSIEDYGLTPLEAAGFGQPTLALRRAGYLDTVREGVTGLFFDRPTQEHVRRAVRELPRHRFDAGVLRAHAARFGEGPFVRRLQGLVSSLAAGERD